MQPDPPGGDPTLFDLEDYGEGSRDENGRRGRALRSVVQGKCPCCLKPSLGLVYSGSHLVWRQHTYVTWGGTSSICRASNVAVCVAPERQPLDSAHPIRCPHDRR